MKSLILDMINVKWWKEWFKKITPKWKCPSRQFWTVTQRELRLKKQVQESAKRWNCWHRHEKNLQSVKEEFNRDKDLSLYLKDTRKMSPCLPRPPSPPRERGCRQRWGSARNERQEGRRWKTGYFEETSSPWQCQRSKVDPEKVY